VATLPKPHQAAEAARAPRAAEEALAYHRDGRPGKIEVRATKPCSSARDLALAYTPGVAAPCREIEANPDRSFAYTARANLVAVVTNGTAVLGLGNIGPAAGKPVMEGKAVLFKRFADIDCFDLELDVRDPEQVVEVVKALEPTFGGINLEDIKAPDCFYVEERLKAEMAIPVFHDDQHGTAIIAAAAFLNALAVTGRELAATRVVFSGAGAAAIATATLLVGLGLPRENLVMCDSKGVISTARADTVNPYKARFARDLPYTTMAEALAGADCFIGVSVAGALTEAMVRSMASEPIVFALANPEPEMAYDEIRRHRPDAIIATGRSDHPNQVNNVLGFPYIFRGALDVRATTINAEMERAAVHAIAALAREEVSEEVRRAYAARDFTFGPDYLIPTPFDSRVLLHVAPAVAAAAMASGVARKEIRDLDGYRDHLEGLLGPGRQLRRTLIRQAQATGPHRIAFPEGKDPAILRACQILMEEGIATPILLGREGAIRARIEELGLELTGAQIIDPRRVAERGRFADLLFTLHQRRGLTREGAARRLDRSRNLFALMMVREGLADGVVTGATQHYQEVIGPILSMIPPVERGGRIAGVYCLVYERRVLFLADTTLHVDPSAEQLAEIACGVADLAASLMITPRVAFLSYADFGSVRHGSPQRARQAVKLFREMRPGVVADGEMQADTALSRAKREANFPFTELAGDANCLIFPSLNAANTAYKLLTHLSECEAIGPILANMPYAVNVLQLAPSPEEVVDMAVITALAGAGR